MKNALTTNIAMIVMSIATIAGSSLMLSPMAKASSGVCPAFTCSCAKPVEVGPWKNRSCKNQGFRCIKVQRAAVLCSVGPPPVTGLNYRDAGGTISLCDADCVDNAPCVAPEENEDPM